MTEAEEAEDVRVRRFVERREHLHLCVRGMCVSAGGGSVALSVSLDLRTEEIRRDVVREGLLAARCRIECRADRISAYLHCHLE